jgi:hypothetical protein
VLEQAHAVRGAAAGSAIVVYANGYEETTDWGTGPIPHGSARIGELDGSDGHTLWARGASGEFYDQGVVAGDALGNAYLIAPGYQADFGPDVPLTGSESAHGVFVGFDKHGAPLFGQRLEYDPDIGILRSVAPGTVAFGAIANAPIDFGSGPIGAADQKTGLFGFVAVAH